MAGRAGPKNFSLCRGLVDETLCGSRLSCLPAILSVYATHFVLCGDIPPLCCILRYLDAAVTDGM